MVISKDEAVARIILGLKDGTMRLYETTRRADGEPAVVLCITAPSGAEPNRSLVRPIAELSMILDSADAGRLYERPKELVANKEWEKKYGRPIGE